MKKTVFSIIAISVSIVFGATFCHAQASSEAQRYIQANNHFQGTEHIPKDTKHALELWTHLAENGHAPSQCIVGYIYLKGYSPWKEELSDQAIVPHEEKAKYWLDKAATGGCPIAAYQLGLIHKNASSENSKDQAIHWLHPFAEMGYDYAQYHMGMIYLNDDVEQTKFWLTKAAIQGHQDAIRELTSLNPDFSPPLYDDISYEHAFSKTADDYFDTSPDLAAVILISLLDKK